MKDKVENVARIFAAAENYKEVKLLVECLLTPQEKGEILHRWQLLEGLVDGDTQRDIAKQLGVSLATISRGSRLLKHEHPEFQELMIRLRKKLEN